MSLFVALSVVVLTAITCVSSQTSTLVNPLKVLSRAPSVFYKGKPSIISFQPSNKNESVLAAVWEESPTTVTPGLNNQQLRFTVSADNGATWGTEYILYWGYNGMGSPQLFFDNSSDILFLYYTSGTVIYQSQSSTMGVEWSHPVEVLAAEGRVSGPVVLTTVEEGQLPVWVFPVENPTVGTVVVKCSRTSTFFEASPILFATNFSDVVLFGDGSKFGIISRSTSSLAHVRVTSDPSGLTGWGAALQISLPTSVGPIAALHFYGSYLLVATLTPNATVSFHQYELLDSGDLKATMSVGVSGVFDVSGLTLLPSRNSSVFDALMVVAGNVAFGEVFVSFAGTATGASAPNKNSTAIAITFVIIGSVVVILVLAFLQGYLRRKAAGESASLLKPEREGASEQSFVSGHGGIN